MNNHYRKFSLVVVVLSILLGSANAQEQPGVRERAQMLLNQYSYANAATLIQKLVDKDNPRLKDLENLALCYRNMNDFEAAETWYSRVIAMPESSAINLLYYGEMLKANLKYAEAKKVFADYATKIGLTPQVALQLAGCDSAITWMANPLSYQIRNETGVNTPLSEFSAYPMGKLVYFTGEPENKGLNKTYGWTGNSFLKIYASTSDMEHNLTNPVVIKSGLNDAPFHQGPLVSDKSQTVFYVTRTYTGSEGEVGKAGKRKYKTSNLELYIYTKNKQTGNYQVQPFAYNKPKEYSVGHASLSSDEKTLYFVSDMPGTLGGTDIWYSDLQSDGTWGKPINVGPSVNTAGNEMFPSVSETGTLYFSTDGLPGMGGLDIFSSKGNKSNWTKAVNLRYPVNSAADDFAFFTTGPTPDGITGYLASNRKGGQGSDDIYTFNYSCPKIILALRGVAFNKKTQERLSDVTVTLSKDGSGIVAKKINEQDGTFFFQLDKESDYKVLGTKIKFYADSAMLTTKGLTKSDTLYAELRLEPLFEEGKTLRLANIHYDFDKDNIRADAAKILNELVRTMRDNPTLEIELASHTDSRGVDIYNLDLSQRRARSVVNYLVSRGIARSRMTAKGYGETRLLNRCSNGVSCSAAEHQQNRRTEFTILKY